MLTALVNWMKLQSRLIMLALGIVVSLAGTATKADAVCFNYCCGVSCSTTTTPYTYYCASDPCGLFGNWIIYEVQETTCVFSNCEIFCMGFNVTCCGFDKCAFRRRFEQITTDADCEECTDEFETWLIITGLDNGVCDQYITCGQDQGTGACC